MAGFQVTKEMGSLLRELTGQPLVKTTRAASMEMLSFGIQYQKNKKGVMYNKGAFGLHLQCPWRMTNGREMLVGSGDLFEPADETDENGEDFAWDEPNANLRDIKMDQIFQNNQIAVISAAMDLYGGLEILFEQDIKLTVFPNITSKADNEYWRLIDFRSEPSIHLVSESTGFELR